MHKKMYWFYTVKERKFHSLNIFTSIVTELYARSQCDFCENDSSFMRLRVPPQPLA